MSESGHGVGFEQAEEYLDKAVNELFAADPRVRSVGITRYGDGVGYRAVRNSAMALPLSARGPSVSRIGDVPVSFADAPSEVKSLVTVPTSGPASPAATSLVPEVHRHRPLACGLEIQNYDDDYRTGAIDRGYMKVGTLGCFVEESDGKVALLSNNHVVAGHNRGQRGADRILQAGNGFFDADGHIAVLSNFEDIKASLPGVTPDSGAVVFNEIDAGVAKLTAGVSFQQSYLPFRRSNVPCFPTSGVSLGEQVLKVDRTTGLTRGEVVDIATVVGPITYATGQCWFRRSVTIEGVNGTQFSDHGDSGSVIVRENGEVVGLLYAGNGQQTYACLIDVVLSRLSCSLVQSS